MNFKVFLSSFNILFLISSTYQLTEYFILGETKLTNIHKYFVPFEQNLLDSNESQFKIELISQVKIENQTFFNLSKQMKLFYFQKVTGEEDNMIMVIDNSNLYCLYIIKDYLLNQQLVIIPHFCNITLPYQSCNKLIQIKNEFFIINCQLNDNQAIISIINLDGKVFDQIQLEIESTCKIDFSYGNQQMLIFEQNCQSNNIYLVEIDEQLYTYKKIEKLELMQENNVTYSQFGYLVNINICNLDRTFFVYQQQILLYSIKENRFSNYLQRTDTTILKLLQPCSSQYLLLDVEHNSQQLRIDQKLLNISNTQYKNSLIVENILVLHFTNYILAKINDQLQYQINLSMSEIIPLIGSPYFISIYQSKLKLFEIQPPKQYHQFNASQRILYLTFTRQHYYSNFNLEQSDIEILKFNETRLIINQQEKIIYQNTDNEDICFQQSLITKSVPINLNAIKENELYYQLKETLNIETCKLNYKKYIKIIYIDMFNNQIKMFIMLKQENIITFVFCQKNEIIQENSLKLMKQIFDILIIEQRNIVICYEESIQLIKIDDSFLIKITNIPLQSKIIKIEKQFGQIKILYENCKQVLLIVIYDQSTLIQDSYSQPFNCTHYYEIMNTRILISQNEILQLSTRNRRYKLEGKIIEVLADVVQNQFVLIVEEGNQITLRFYRLFLKSELIFQYIIPTYNYQYQLSNAQKFDNSYLMINAKNQNKLYLLVYDLKNSAINALIYVTEIDESYQFYQLFDSFNKTLVYFYDGKLFYHQLDYICFRYLIQQLNVFIMKKEFELVMNSPTIGNQSVTINIQVSQLNNDYILTTLNYTQKNIVLKETIDWDLIKGNIISVDVQPKQDFIIKLPINITQEYMSCQYFESNLCLNNMSLIEIKSLNIIETFNFYFDLDEIKIKGINFNQELLIYSVFYTTHQNLFLLIIQLEKKKSNYDQYVIINKERVQSILPQYLIKDLEKMKIIQDIYFLQLDGNNIKLLYKDICQFIDTFEIQEQQYYYMDCAYLSNHTYLIIYLMHNNIKFKFISFINMQLISQFNCKADIIQQQEIQIPKFFNKSEFFQFEKTVKKIEIFNLEKKGDFYFIKLLLIYQTDFSVIIEISFADIIQDTLKIESYRYLRYEKNSQFLELLYADNNLILATFQQGNNQFVNVYDIKGEMINKDYLDSIQRIESFDYKRIEKFNSSHYVMFSNSNKRLYFITLNQFKVECFGQCTENANLILSNDVSSINIEIQLDNSLLENVLNINVGIFISNFLFILIFIKYGKRTNRSSLQRK